jgi:hypothetical protein
MPTTGESEAESEAELAGPVVGRPDAGASVFFVRTARVDRRLLLLN